MNDNLKKIYEVIADKIPRINDQYYVDTIYGKQFWVCCWFKEWWIIIIENISWDRFETKKIIWKQVMIWDVLDWMEKNIKSYMILVTPRKMLLEYYKLKSLPIDDQSKECQDFIFWLIE